MFFFLFPLDFLVYKLFNWVMVPFVRYLLMNFFFAYKKSIRFEIVGVGMLDNLFLT